MLSRKAQSSVEYAFIIAVTVAAFIGVQTYMRRGIQGKMKEATDSIGRQFEPSDNFTTQWRRLVNGTTTTVETRNASGGDSTTTITSGENTTTDEYESWGTEPARHNWD